MVSEIYIYFEGSKKLKEGFRKFFGEIHDRARTLRCIIRWTDGRGRDQAIQDFKIALQKHPEQMNLLLLDSEAEDTGSLSEGFCRSHKLDAGLVRDC